MSFSQTKKELLAKLLSKEGISDKDWSRITKHPFKEMYPLSYSQRRLWFIEQLQPGNAAYNVPVVLRITGNLDLSALKHAFQSLVHRHAVLRTRFAKIDGEPFQIVEPEIELNIEIEDRRESSAEQISEEVSAEAGKGYELEKAGLMRVRIWRTKDGEYKLLLVMHHIITDGWSMGILVKHLASEYTAQVRGEHGFSLSREHLQYTDYAEWQKAQTKELEKQTDYWRNMLAGKPETGEFPADFERPAKPLYKGKRLEIKIETNIAEKLKQVGREQGATLYMVLVAALKILLWRYSGEEDVSIGSPAANRRRGQTDEIIGFFVNTLVINERIHPHQTFKQYLAKIQQTILDAFANQDVPFEKLVEIIQPERRQGVNPVFQTVFNWQEAIADKFALPGLEIQAVDFYSGLTRFDMEFHLSEKNDGEISGYLIFNSSIYGEESCRRLIENFINLLNEITTNQDSKIRDLKFLTDREKEKILNEFVFNPVDYPSEKTLKELFEAQAVLRPDAVCLKFGGETLSYKDVNDRSNRVAAFLIENGIKPEEFIGLSAERSFELVIGLLGIVKAGGVYVPLDESYPVERLTAMFEDTGIKTVLTGRNNIGARFQNDILFKSIEEILETQPFSNNPETRLEPENLAYIMFTSGSTGKPKGVSISHRAVVRLAVNNDFAKFGENEIFLLLAPVSFDASTLEIWGSLLNGSQLAIMPPGIPTPEILEREIEANNVTTLWLTSGLFNLVMDRKPSALRKIKQLLAGGDILSSEIVHGFLEMFPDAVIINGYGPTENTTFSCCYPMTSGKFYGKNIPIGFPVANSEVFILDTKMNLIPQGAVGEIYVGGDGLARGYHNQPHLTGGNFVPHPFSEKHGQRLYKTGDLGRLRNDGSVEFRGRKDKQVKVRGYRIELAEIETALMKHSAVRDAAVITDDTNERDKNLVAFVVCENNENLSGKIIRKFLQKHLPDFMIPPETVIVSNIPLTENGKVDRKNLLSLKTTVEPKSVKPPTDSIEIEISKIWSEVLDGKQIGTDENFFEVGGHSLAAVKIISKSNSYFNVEIPLQDFFENPTIVDLGNFVRQNLNATNDAESAPGITRLKNRDSYPMSYSQRRLWFIEQLQSGNAAYNVPAVLRINGNLQFDALKYTFQSLIERHESLRTRFTEIGGEPFQIVEPEIELNLKIEDFREMSAEALDEEIRAETGRGFDLEQAGQLRVRIFRTKEEEYVMLVVMHHIITDGWSMGILVKHLASEYEKFTGLTETHENDHDSIGDINDVGLQYGDYAKWQVGRLESGKLSAHIDYWTEELKDAGSRSELPADYVKPFLRSFDGGQLEIILDDVVSAKLNRIGREQGATLYMVLAAALKILLWRYSGEEEISIGCPAANRETEEMSEIIGFFVNTLVIKSRLEPEKTFTGFLKQVKSKALKAFANQDVPFEKLVEIIHPERDWNGVPLFQVMLILQNFPFQKIELSGLEITPVQSYGGKAKLDLVFNLREENGRICGNIEYAKEIFKKESIERLGGQFINLLKNLSESPDTIIAELKLTTDEEETRLLKETRLTDEFRGENLIHDLFEKAVEKFPLENALEYNERFYDYDSLNKKANRIANAINSQITGKSAIGLMISDPVEQIAAMLGVLKSGNHFFCLDPDHPLERLEQILNETAPGCLITDSESREKQTGLFFQPETKIEKIIISDSDKKESAGSGILFGKNWLDTFPETSPDVNISPEDLAYIVYSSGSTGKPKGIMQTHKSFSQFINWFGNEFELAPKIKLAQWASVTYDAAYAEIFSALAFGATLCLTDSNTKNDPEKADRWIFENNISVFQTVPGFFDKMFRESEKQAFSKLKYVLLAGEVLPVDLVEEWLENHPDSPVLYNLYGPTESVLATFHKVKEIEHRAKSVSIGRAIDGRQILILDKQKQLCPVGVPGEIYIRSAYLTKGYFNSREETGQRFIANPLTGDPNDLVFKTGDLARWTHKDHIEFLGRIDSLVKIRGNRIEIEEIERALMQLPQITNCAVVAAKDKAGQLQLFAFVVSDEEISATLVRKLLAQKLPVYMLPSTILFIEKIPLTASGKTDKIYLISQIPEMPESLRQEYVAPKTELEKELVELWQKLLEIEKIGLDDDFFQLGGHSLLAVQIVNKVRRDYQTEITLRSFLMNPTVRQLGENITLSKCFSGTDPIRLAAFVEKVKNMSDDEVVNMTASLLDSKNNGMSLGTTN